MKKAALFILLILSVSSCEKDDKLPRNPDWLNTRISQLENSPLPGMVIWLYEWDSDYYYVIYNHISSCLFCEMYDYSGSRVTFSEAELEDFTKNGKMIKAVWEKGYSDKK